MTIDAHIAGVPALFRYTGSIGEAAQRGTILFFHGLGASKETGDKELTSFANNGFLAIGLDNVGHGHRRYNDFDYRLSSSNPEFETEFIRAVSLTAAEVPAIIDELIAKHNANPQRFGVAGISMGGFVTYAALTEDQRIKAACPILGSPEFNGSPSESPHHQLDLFYPRAILSQNAGKDQSVPPRAAREFTRALSPYYEQNPSLLKYIEFPGAGHFMPESDWNRLWQNVIDWFVTFLI